jgi:hypothetical protein
VLLWRDALVTPAEGKRQRAHPAVKIAADARL